MNRICVGVVAVGMLAACGSGPGVSGDAGTQFIHRTVIAAPGDAGDDFGADVALSGDGKTLAIGTAYAGLAYVYVFNGTSWEPQAALSVDAKWGGFGRELSINEDGSMLAVGADFESLDGGEDENGAVYVFKRTGTTWSLDTHLTDPAPMPGDDHFGLVISMSRDGAELATSRAGAVHIYERVGGAWAEQSMVQTLGAPLLSGDGNTMVLGGSTIVGLDDGGSKFEDAALLYKRNGNSWANVNIVTYPEPIALASTFALSRDGSSIALSAVDEQSVGVAYVLDRDPQGWNLEGELSTVAAPPGFVGAQVVMNDDASRVAVSMPSASGANDAGWVGGVWVYTRGSMAVWSSQHLEASDDKPRQFGRYMSMSGDGSTLAVAAPPLGIAGVQGHVDVFTTR